jgi:lysophospholipase L1-like esterase
VWPRRLAVFAAILAAEFVALEAGLRVAGGSEAGATFQSLFLSDPQVGHRLRPGARMRYVTREFDTPLAINGQGVRDDEEIGPKAADERRVVILGDSLVMSVQVPLAETFAERLEAHLASADPAHRWRVINAGVQGYGPVDEWFFFDRVAASFEPDIVLIVAFVGNDAIEAADHAAAFEANQPVIATETSAARARTWLRRLVRSSLVLQYARVRVDQLRAKLATGVPERPLATYLTEPPPEVARGLDVSRRVYERIAARAASAGAATGIVLMPARFQTDDPDHGRLAEAVRVAGGVLDRQAASRRFAEAIAPLGLPSIDVQPVLAAQPDRIGLFFRHNVHLTPRGHAVVAAALYRFLRETPAFGRFFAP